MGISITEWRARIGSFSQPQSASRCTFSKTSVLNAKSITLCLRIALFLILIAQCIEPNPGPGRSGKQLFTTNSASASSSSTDTLLDQRELRSTGRQRSSISNADQTEHSLSSWLRSDPHMASTSSGSSRVDRNPTNHDKTCP